MKSLSYLLFVTSLLLNFRAVAAQSEQGLLDLRDLDHTQLTEITIKSNWQFHWGKLVDPASPWEENTSSSYLRADKEWTAQGFDKSGHASYRLKVLLPEDLNEIAIKLTSLGTFSLYLDDKLIAQAGSTAESPDESFNIGFTRSLHDAKLSKSSFILTLHLSDYYGSGGGLRSPVVLGEFSKLSSAKNMDILVGSWVSGCMFFVIVYHLFLFFFRRSEPATLFCALACFNALFYSLMLADQILFEAFSFLEPESVLRAISVFMPLSSLALSLFIRRVFGDAYPKLLLYAILAITTPLMLAGPIVSPQTLGPLILKFIPLIAIVTYALNFAVTGVAIAKKIDSAWIIFAGFTIWFSAIILDVMRVRGVDLPFKVRAPFGNAIFSLSLATLVSRRFSQAFSNLKIAKKEIQGLNANLEKQVIEKTRDIIAIMENIPQGICAVYQDEDELFIHKDYSECLKQILESDELENAKFSQAFLSHLTIGSDQKQQLIETIKSTIDQDELNFEANSHLLPTEAILVSNNQQEHIVEIDWNPITAEDGTVTKILVALRDVTLARELLEKSKATEKEMQRIYQILGIEEGQFQNFIKQAEVTYLHCKRSLESDMGSEEKRNLLIHLHTFKGVSRSYGFTDMSSCVHEIENILSHDGDRIDAKLENEKFIDLVNVYKHIDHEVLKRDQSSDFVKLNINDLELVYKGLSPSKQPQARQTLESVLFVEDENLYAEVRTGATAIALELGKTLPNLHRKGPQVLYTRTSSELLRNTLTHMLRNSLDHGIEHSEKRLEIGKPAIGEITIEHSLEAGQLLLKVFDDGRGLNLRRLYEAAAKNGFSKPFEACSHNELAELVFFSGVSTAEKVSEISGRGVGMDAVRAYVEEAGGEVFLELGDTKDLEKVSFKTCIKLKENFYSLKIRGDLAA